MVKEEALKEVGGAGYLGGSGGKHRSHKILLGDDVVAKGKGATLTQNVGIPLSSAAEACANAAAMRKAKVSGDAIDMNMGVCILDLSPQSRKKYWGSEEPLSLRVSVLNDSMRASRSSIHGRTKTDLGSENDKLNRGRSRMSFRRASLHTAKRIGLGTVRLGRSLKYSQSLKDPQGTSRDRGGLIFLLCQSTAFTRTLIE